MARVLIVDDAAFMRHLLAKMLEGVHEVCGEAANGMEGVDLYKRLLPDIVTMDISMPDMEGIEALRRILSFDPNAKILICSAIGYRQMVLEAIKCGAKDFITKPFQKERLLDAIARWV
ncbi:response regulator [Brevibacillus massiliensis]|uniref:response regulator n=1 Tax=Brevibacillus massiliensis TaxID=1118054 RepID=UPI0002D6B9B2|nr:response regulator [Brevibacillus massiliensis]